MSNLSKKIEKRLNDPELNKKFTEEVNKKKNVTEEDKRNYQQIHEVFQRYKKSKDNI